MEVDGFDFPQPLLDALRYERLVVFAGAGVSMGTPAELPSFHKLVNDVAEGTGESIDESPESYENFLQRLEKDHNVNIHERAAEILNRKGLKHNNLHRNLLRLFRETGPVRIVTTNFDCLFEQAAKAEGLFKTPPKIFEAPALPPGNRFQGIVRLHGSVHEPEEMVLTRHDFGRAYLTEAGGWAGRFVVDLFAKHTILFVGYSHRDTIMNYLTPSLPKNGTEKFFTLVGSESTDRGHWHDMGIKPVIFPQENKHDFSGLDRAVEVLASCRRHYGTLEDYYNLGLALSEQGDLEGAIKAYRQVDSGGSGLGGQPQEGTPLSDYVLSKFQESFRPRARLLQLLGDELIGSPRLAVFELVKNAYDADANKVVVTIDLASEHEPGITIEDDGEGMTVEKLRSVWLIPGDDHRQKQRQADERTAKHQRLPLGEKGLGRFAVHKLGNHITLVTRAQDADECVVEIDWNTLVSKPFLDDAPVTIQVRRPETFLGNRTGTRIEIRQLRNNWSRGEVRRLHNQTTSICSPFQEPGGFKAELLVPGEENWIKDLPDIHKILDRAIWKFFFQAKNKAFNWTYEFRQIPGLALDGRKKVKTGDRLKLPPRSGDDRMEKKVVADEEDFNGIGLVTGEFYVYDRDHEIRSKMSDTRLVESYLDETGGVRVYRDGIRVYNYGEQGDDWLGLDLRRVNIPTRRISRNIILGAINLSLKESTGLVEKTNREGFVDNETCERLRCIVLAVLATLEAERQLDKERIRRLTKKPDDPVSARIEKPIQDLRRELKRKGVQDQFENYVAKIEQDYQNMQETLLTAGMSGLNLAVVFHEVERGVRALYQAISEGVDMKRAALQARDLMSLLDGFAILLRRSSKKRYSAGKLLKAAQTFNMLRFRHHHIQFVCPSIQKNDKGFYSHFAFNLVIGALNNLIDNSLYWLRVRWPEDRPKLGNLPQRKLYIGISYDLEPGPAIIVADNGTGFQGDDPDNLVRPFFTRKPEGMGLGLYYANLAMELNSGRLVFPQPGAVDIPKEFDGAVAAMVFQEVK